MDTLLPTSQTEKKLHELRVKILFNQNMAAQLSGLVVAGLYVFLFWDKGDPKFLTFWIATLLGLTAIRFSVLRYFSRHYVELEKPFNPSTWENVFVGLNFAAGICWGVAVCCGAPSGDLYSDSMMGYVLAGITAGASVAYSSSLKATYSFFIPAVIPFAIRLSLTGDSTHWSMACMLFAYSLVYVRLARQFNEYAISSISLSFQKEKLIERIRTMQSKVTHSAQMVALGEMAGGMAHEINNPLAVIKIANSNVTDVLSKEFNSPSLPRVLKYLESVNSATDRITKVVRSLRSFAGRPGDETFDLVPVRKLIYMVTDFCNERFKNNGVILKISEIPEELTIECRPFQTTQVVLNLLNNSLDAIKGKQEKWVHLEVSDLGETVEISVTDSGSGIPEEIQNKIMLPFFTTKEIGKGMGLGLSISKGVLLNHHGELRLDSGYPHTRFVVTLPKKQPHQTAAAA